MKDVYKDLGITADRWSASVLDALYGLRDAGKPILRDAGKLTAEFHPNVMELDTLVKKVKAQPTEAERLETIASYRGEMLKKVRGSKAAAIVKAKPETILQREVVRFKKFLETGNDGKPFPSITEKETVTAVAAVIHALKALRR